MNFLQHFVMIIGRMCLSLIFILSAVAKVLDWQGTEGALLGAFSDLLHYTPQYPELQSILTWALSSTNLLLIVATIFELLGGLLIFLGVQVRFGAFLLLLFLIPTTVTFHHFWYLQGADHNLQMIMFLKNLSIFGGLLYLLALGKGDPSPKGEKSSGKKK